MSEMPILNLIAQKSKFLQALQQERFRENDLSVIKMAFEDSSLKHGKKALRLQIRLPGGEIRLGNMLQ